MTYRVLADLTVLLHLAFLVFVILGGLAVARWPRVAWVHLPCVAWGAWIELAGWVCPLTPLENRLRARGGEAGYASGFVEHYVLPVIYPDALTREIQYVFAGLVLLINALAYAWILRRRRRV